MREETNFNLLIVIIATALITIITIILSIWFTVVLHFHAVLAYANYLLLYLSIILMDHSEDFMIMALDKTLFSVYMIVLFVLDTKWYI